MARDQPYPRNSTIRKMKHWDGWRQAIDEELQSAGGSMPWSRLQKKLIRRYQKAMPRSELLADVIGLGALSNLQETHLSDSDNIVRLPVLSCSSQPSLEAELAKAGDDLVVVDFYSAMCKPCQVIKPEFYQLAAEMPDVTFLEIDVTSEDALCLKYGVTSLPSFGYFKNQKLQELYSGIDIDEITMKMLMSK
eukprot:TRINITY_DN68644_c0_g1_i1.p1 TRINITY_DN68644_c0_g1~~TRINITY_DN68644_c0_g1_i1.p1  ORF type:complete len:214 (+),score=33.35 TRINITY_DN68644_c0_g1_i1:68-643(+)